MSTEIYTHTPDINTHTNDNTNNNNEHRIHFHIVRMPRDGGCLFRSVTESIGIASHYHLEVRHRCCEYILKHREMFELFVEAGKLDEHVAKMRSPRCWGGDVEMKALALAFSLKFCIYYGNGDKKNQTGNSSMLYEYEELKNDGEKVRMIKLLYSNGNHYDLLLSQAEYEARKIAQQLVYELLSEPSNDNDYVWRNIPYEQWMSGLELQNGVRYGHGYASRDVGGEADDATDNMNKKKKKNRNRNKNRSRNRKQVIDIDIGIDCSGTVQEKEKEKEEINVTPVVSTSASTEFPTLPPASAPRIKFPPRPKPESEEDHSGDFGEKVEDEDEKEDAEKKPKASWASLF